jgi:magnesium transporter
MLSKQTLKNLTWVDLHSPTPEEVREIMEEFKLHPLVAEELLVPTLKPRVENYNHFIYLILHFPALRHTHNSQENQEVDFILGKNFVITTRYDTIDPLHKFSKMFEVNALLGRGEIGNHSGYVFLAMLKKLYGALMHELEYITDALDEVEERIFKGNEQEMVVELSKISRDLLNFKQALGLHRDVLESFKETSKPFYGDDFSYHARAIIGEYFRVRNLLGSNMAVLAELRETNNSLVSTKQNEVMKILTIMAFVTFPLSLMASVFGMNTSFLPIVGNPYDFWIIIGMMATATVCFFAFFKYKKWL